MIAYINGVGNISAQQSWDGSLLSAQPLGYEGDKVSCYEPDYTKYIDPKHLRRMSRIIKMGVAAGSIALKDAGVLMPNGVITGTAYGCLEDTGIFLNKMIDNKEHALNPTPFIQSTHNTIGSQIALLLQCQGYNQTYTQGAFSFENSLLDALLDLQDDPAQSILVGGVDEITNFSHTLLKRFGIFKDGRQKSLDLFTSQSSGTINGEGAAYFVLSGKRADHSVVCIESVATYYKPEGGLEKKIDGFLKASSLDARDIDLILLGKCGDQELDAETGKISGSMFVASTVGLFKHLSGEYPTASAFAVWLATKIMRENYVPDYVVFNNVKRPVKRVLIYNPYFGAHHSLILLKHVDV
jgi:3-oxoacyl-(acyl-carrier-protein) synthase